MKHIPDRHTINGIAETAFLIVLAIYFFYLGISNTVFWPPFPQSFEPLLLSAFILITVLKIITDKKDCGDIKDLLAMSFILFSFLLSYVFSGYYFLLFIPFVTICCYKIRYEKILKIYLLCIGSCVLLGIIGCELGLIDNYVYLTGAYIRSSFGNGYPTDFSSEILYLSMFLILLLKNRSLYIKCFIVAVSLFVTWFLAHSRTSSLCNLLFLCMLIAVYLFEKHPDCKFTQKTKSRLYKLILIFIPMIILLFFISVYLYGKNVSIFIRMNQLVSGRLKLTYDGIEKYGIKFFGQAIEFNGNGSGRINYGDEYNFLDNSYALLIVRYGLFVFVSVTAEMVYLLKRSINNKQYILAGIILIIAIHSLSEHHLSELNYNLLLLFPFASFEPVAEERNAVSGQRWKACRVSFAIILTVFIFFAPKCISIGRTMLHLFEFSGNKGQWLKLIISIAILLCAIVLLYSFCLLVTDYIEYKKMNKHAMISMLCISAICMFSLLTADHVIQNRGYSYSEQIKQESDVLSLILQSNTGRVYADEVPYIYQKELNGISDSVFYGSDFARVKNGTIITSADNEYPIMFRKGFLFTEISDSTAVYTNDYSVIEALKKAGLYLNAYYPVKQNADLKYLAELNALPFEKNQILLHESIQYGPYIHLYAGKYNIDYLIETDEPLEQEELICKVRLSTDYGQGIRIEKNVYGNDFNDQGIATVTLVSNMGNERNVEFLVFKETEKNIKIDGITYQKIPDYDIHSTYDSKMRKTRDEYYTREGLPTLNNSGYFAVEYEYDRNDNINWFHYYGLDDEPVLLSNGTSSVYRIYNIKKQIIHEEYYGTDGKRVLNVNGYAALDEDYDSKGNVSCIRYLGIDGNTIITKQGYAELHRQFNEKRQIIREEYYGTDSEPIILPAGYAMNERDYDDYGNAIVQKYYDEHHDPVIINAGYAEVHRVFDINKRIIFEEYFDIDGTRLTLNDGYSMIEREYDNNGNAIIQRFYDAEGRPVMIKQGYAEVHRSFDQNRRVIHEEYYDTEGKIMLLNNSYAMVDRSYDSAGNVIIHVFKDKEGKPTIVNSGYAELHRSFDDHRYITREEYYGMSGEKILLPAGYFANEREYDNNGNAIVQRYYDINDQLVSINAGYAEIHRKFNTNRKIIEEEYFGTDGAHVEINEGYSKVERTYDDSGNMTGEMWFNNAGDILQKQN